MDILTLEILEYCDSKYVISREQYYIDLLKPKYNILKIAGSNLGYKHSEETRAKISVAGKGKTLSELTKAKMSDSQKAVNRSGKNHPMFGKAKPEGAGTPSQKIEVLDLLTNERIEYESINAAALALGVNRSTISLYFINNQKKPYKNRYTFKKIKYSEELKFRWSTARGKYILYIYSARTFDLI